MMSCDLPCKVGFVIPDILNMAGDTR